MQAGQEIVDRATGERLIFLTTATDTGGAYLEFEDHLPAGVGRATSHVHPVMEERWEVLDGSMLFTIDDRELRAGPGDVVVAPAGAPHQIANSGEGTARLLVRMTPALRWQEAATRLFALSAAGIASGDGPPSREGLRQWLSEFSAEIVLGGPAGGHGEHRGS